MPPNKVLHGPPGSASHLAPVSRNVRPQQIHLRALVSAILTRADVGVMFGTSQLLNLNTR